MGIGENVGENVGENTGQSGFTSTEDAFVHGEPFILTSTMAGAVFGTKATAAPMLFDRMDDSSYSGLSDGDPVPVGPSYVWTDATYGNTSGADEVLFDDQTTARHPNGVAMYRAESVGTAYLDGQRWTSTGTCYISWWFKVDKDISSDSACGGDASGSCKMLRMSDKSDEGGKTYSSNFFQDYVFDSTECSGGGGYCNLNGWGSGECDSGNYPTENEWTFFEWWADNSAQTWSWRKSGVALSDDEDYSPGDIAWDEMGHIGMETNDAGGWTGLPSWWMSDIYLDTSLARVLLGNASTYSSCTTFEMQPPTSWSNTSITVTANVGAETGTSYLYVIKSDGTIVNSSGYAVTI